MRLSQLANLTGSDVVVATTTGHNANNNASSFNDTMVLVTEHVYLYLEDHVGWMVITAVIIGLAAIIGTLGNVLVSTSKYF